MACARKVGSDTTFGTPLAYDRRRKKSYLTPLFPAMTQPLLRAAQLTKIVTSGEAPLTILDDVGFSVYPGDAVAIVGASGSGKTTLLGLLAGLDRPTRGDVWLDGHVLSGLDEDAR